MIVALLLAFTGIVYALDYTRFGLFLVLASVVWMWTETQNPRWGWISSPIMAAVLVFALIVKWLGVL